jgi:hypothetical protein
MGIYGGIRSGKELLLIVYLVLQLEAQVICPEEFCILLFQLVPHKGCKSWLNLHNIMKVPSSKPSQPHKGMRPLLHAAVLCTGRMEIQPSPWLASAALLPLLSVACTAACIARSSSGPAGCLGLKLYALPCSLSHLALHLSVWLLPLQLLTSFCQHCNRRAVKETPGCYR